MNHDSILIFHFHCNFMLNYIEEHKLDKNPLFRQKLKNSLKTFHESLKGQIDTFCYGSIKRPLPDMSNEAADGLHFGTMYIDQYFDAVFKLNDLLPDEQEKFQKEYDSLLNKYQLTK